MEGAIFVMFFILMFPKPLSDLVFCISNMYAGRINFVIVIVIVSGSKPLEDLVNDPSDSLRKICDRFDTSPAGLGNYEDVAKGFGYNVFTARSRFKKSEDGPSKALILAIIAEQPRVTVESFARVVEKQARRNDVAILLREFDRK